MDTQPSPGAPDPTRTDATGSEAAPRPPVPRYKAVAPHLFAVAFLLVMVGVVRWATFVQQTYPEYAGGIRPASKTVNYAGLRSQRANEASTFAWDVSRRVETSFTAAFQEGYEEDGRINHVQGTLTVSVPPRCAGKSVEWLITAGDRTISRGGNHHKRSWSQATWHDLDDPSPLIKFTASWDGGAGQCHSFKITWSRVALSRDIPWPWELRFYGIG